MRIAITGVTGFIGARLSQYLQTSHELIELRRSSRLHPGPSFDLSQPTSLSASLESLEVDVVIHAGGLARRRQCEMDPKLAYTVNVDATRVIAKWCSEHGVRLLFFSSIGIYENNVYAQTKRLAERHIEESGVQYCTLRLAYTFGMSPSTSRPKPQMYLEAEARQPGSQMLDSSWWFQPTSLTHVCKVVDSFLVRSDTFPREASIVTPEATTMHMLASACLGHDVRSCTRLRERSIKHIDTQDNFEGQVPLCSLADLHDELGRVLISTLSLKQQGAES
jgi:dTDP-4-dehydrorhamnose reductase